MIPDGSLLRVWLNAYYMHIHRISYCYLFFACCNCASHVGSWNCASGITYIYIDTSARSRMYLGSGVHCCRSVAVSAEDKVEVFEGRTMPAVRRLHDIDPRSTTAGCFTATPPQGCQCVGRSVAYDCQEVSLIYLLTSVRVLFSESGLTI